MPEFSRSFFQISYGNPFFVAIVLVAVVLMLVALAFVSVALYVRFRSTRRRAQVKHREDQWRPLLLELLAGERSADDVLGRVEYEERRDFLDLVYCFARRVQGRHRAVLREIAYPLLSTLDADAEASRPEHRARRIQIVGLLGLSEYLDDVVHALDDEAPLVAIVAARALARREHPEHVTKVLDKLDRFASWSDSTLSSLLANLGLAVAPALRDTLADGERTAWVRATVADALRKLDDVKAGDIAARLLREDVQSRQLVTASLRLLKAVGRPEHYETVAALTEHDDYAVRIHAVGALSQIADARAIDRLIEATNDPSRWVAIQAVEGLKRAGQRDALRNLAAGEGERAELAQQALVEKSVVVR